MFMVLMFIVVHAHRFNPHLINDHRDYARGYQPGDGMILSIL
jgi:hypothetical protein